MIGIHELATVRASEAPPHCVQRKGWSKGKWWAKGSWWSWHSKATRRRQEERLPPASPCLRSSFTYA